MDVKLLGFRHLGAHKPVVSRKICIGFSCLFPCWCKGEGLCSLISQTFFCTYTVLYKGCISICTKENTSSVADSEAKSCFFIFSSQPCFRKMSEVNTYNCMLIVKHILQT